MVNILLAPSEESEDDGHLQGIREYCEKASSYSCIAHPESRNGVPEYECAIMIDPYSLLFEDGGNPFHAQQGNQAEQGKDSGVWYKDGD